MEIAMTEQTVYPQALRDYLQRRPLVVRGLEWANGRRYLISQLRDRPMPLVVIAHSVRDADAARRVAHALEHDWAKAPQSSRETYDEILLRVPEMVVIQLRRKNLCGCLGHRHVLVTERPFAEHHAAFAGLNIGEMDIAFERVNTWQPLPLSDTAWDTKFLEGSRLEEFHACQFRLRMLMVFLHETNHLVFPQESEATVRERSLNFYREALAAYVEETLATLSLTIDRSFSRLR
jgi:hypothetical protein